jgi:hypothetical protein
MLRTSGKGTQAVMHWQGLLLLLQQEQQQHQQNQQQHQQQHHQQRQQRQQQHSRLLGSGCRWLSCLVASYA